MADASGDEVDVIVKELEDFEGDTTFTVDGAVVNLKQSNGEIEVEVNAEQVEGGDEVKKEVKVIKKVIKQE